MNECFGKNFILNGELHPAEQFDNSFVYEGDSVYEVLRMQNGSPVFFADHMERLSSSSSLSAKEILADGHAIRKAIISLNRSEHRREANLKIVFNYNDGTGNWLVYFIEPTYPTSEQYSRGVKGILIHAERKNPESKVINHKLRSEIYHRLILDGAYEALLVNDNNLVTEGSRSNVFFLRDNILNTAPDSLILNGITRKHILEICSAEKIRVEFKAVIADEIGEYESVFMTGTSPIVLPFCCIGNSYFNVGSALTSRLRKLYVKRMEESVRLFRSQ